jgi:hypothetical protein
MQIVENPGAGVSCPSPRCYERVVVVVGGTSGLATIDAGILRELDSRAGEVSVSVAVAVPSTAAGGTVSLNFGLVPDGATETSTSAHASYRVAS